MADVESSNIVGYNTGTTGSDNNFITIPFAQVGFNTSDIQQIALDDGGEGSLGWGGEIFEIWAGAPEVVAGSGFFYLDPSMDPAGEATTYYWGDESSAKASFSVAPGQGVVVNCAENLTSMTAGEVPVGDVTFTSVADNNFTGNPFSSNIDIQDISLDDGGEGSLGWGGEIFEVWAGAPEVVAGSGFFYLDPSMDPAGEATTYYWGDESSAKAEYSIAPGKGVVINCAEGLTVTIKAPYSL